MGKIIQFPGTGSGGGGSDHTPESGRNPISGLTGKESKALLGALDKAAKRVVTLTEEVSPEAALEAPIIPRVTGLLETIQRNQPLRLTSKGFLPQAVVKMMMKGAYAGADEKEGPVNRESDSPALLFERRLAEKAGFLVREYKNGPISLTEEGTEILQGKEWGRLYTGLLGAYLEDPWALAAYDGYEDGGFFSHFNLFLLHLCRGTSGSLLYPEDLARLLGDTHPDPDGFFSQLKAFSPPRLVEDPLESLQEALEIRFFRRFALRFGLLREEPPRKSPLEEMQRPEQRIDQRPHPFSPAPLLGQAFRWRPPAHAHLPLSEEQGAEFLALQAEEFLENPSPAYPEAIRNHTAALFHRSLARDARNTHAYLGLIRLGRTGEEALAVADAALDRCAGIQPEIPPGMSPLEDPAYAAFSQIKMTRAQLLLSLSRFDEAAEAFRSHLEEHPENPLGAPYSLFAALAARNRFQEACQVMEEWFDPDTPDYAWDCVLLAYAEGGAKAARPYLPAALGANPHVPDMIGDLRRLPSPDLEEDFPEDSPDYAALYLLLTAEAWQAVKGARQWVKKQG